LAIQAQAKTSAPLSALVDLASALAPEVLAPEVLAPEVMDAETQIEGFIDKFADTVAAEIRAARAEMRHRLPGAVELVYDNYNALAIGYSASERLKDVIFSIACFPHWLRLFFYHGASLEDPHGLLEGEGAQVRSIKLTSLAILEDLRVRALMDQALAKAAPIDPSRPSRSIVKSIAARQRPRRAPDPPGRRRARPDLPSH